MSNKLELDCSIYSFKWHLKQYLLVNNVDVCIAQ